MTPRPLAVLAGALALAAAWWLIEDAREPGERHGEPGAVPVEPAPAEPAMAVLAPPADPVATPVREREAPAEVPPDPATTVSVLVHTRKFLTREAAPVAGIGFQVFAQRASTRKQDMHVFTHVVPLAPDDAPLAEGRTDATGVARVTLRRSALRFDGSDLPLVCARVVEPGYQACVSFGQGSKDGGVDCEIPLMAKPGATARGRVVDAEGHAIEAPNGPFVQLRQWYTPPEGVRYLSSVGGARLLEAGAFELDYDEPVADGVILADASAQGTGVLAGVQLTLAAPPQDLVVVVRGPGVLRGRVLDGGGAPAAGLELFLGLAALDDEVGSTILPEPERSLREVQGGGHLWRALQTGADGAFEVRGLRAEPYVVRAKTQETSAYPHLLTPVPVRPDGDELVLRLSRPHVVVRLLDAEGNPWSGAAPEVVRRSSRASLPADWPAEPRVGLFPCASDGSSVGGDELEGRRVGTAEIVFEVPAGARYVAAIVGGGFDGVPQVVDVPEGGNAVPVEFRARELGELGALSVRVFSAGKELRGARGLEIVVETLASAAPLLESARWRGVYPHTFRVPPGAYRVVAAGKGETDSHHGTLMVPRALGRAESEVEVRAGATQELTLTLDTGARLGVTLAGKADETDLAAMRKRYTFLADPERAAELATMAAHARLSLEREGHRSEPVEFTVVLGATSAAGTHLEGRWPLGATHFSEVLPTGAYTLVARLPGGRERRVEVDLVESATTKVSLEF